MMLAVEAEGCDILTAEGLTNVPIQHAFVDFDGFQCGYCTVGFLMNAHALIAAHPEDDKADREWLESNLRRCTGYEGIRRAVGEARKKVAASTERRDGKSPE